MQIKIDDQSRLIDGQEHPVLERGLMFALASFSNEVEAVQLSFSSPNIENPNVGCICSTSVTFGGGRTVDGPTVLVQGEGWRSHLERRMRRLISREMGPSYEPKQLASEH